MIAGEISTIVFITQDDLPREGSNFERESQSRARCECVASSNMLYLWLTYEKYTNIL